ncbi:MAG: TylF/MycF/NovP-related O-methyltransferase [Gemmatimonadaceae bacterium]
MHSEIAEDTLHELAEAARAAPPGDLVEVGVYKGGSATRLAEVAREQNRMLFLFDTFTGIPTADPEVDHHKIGDFGDTTLEAVRSAIPEAIFKPGIFPETLTDDVGPIALAHIDCDQYASVKACCAAIAPRMVSGGVMVFDDYDVLPGAKKAVEEAFAGRVVMSARGKARVFF